MAKNDFLTIGLFKFEIIISLDMIYNKQMQEMASVSEALQILYRSVLHCIKTSTVSVFRHISKMTESSFY